MIKNHIEFSYFFLNVEVIDVPLIIAQVYEKGDVANIKLIITISCYEKVFSVLMMMNGKCSQDDMSLEELIIQLISMIMNLNIEKTQICFSLRKKSHRILLTTIYINYS